MGFHRAFCPPLFDEAASPQRTALWNQRNMLRAGPFNRSAVATLVSPGESAQLNQLKSGKVSWRCRAYNGLTKGSVPRRRKKSTAKHCLELI